MFLPLFSQDTVVALHAISEIAPFISPPVSNINVKFVYPDGQQVMQVTSSRPLDVHEIEVSKRFMLDNCYLAVSDFMY